MRTYASCHLSTRAQCIALHRIDVPCVQIPRVWMDVWWREGGVLSQRQRVFECARRLVTHSPTGLPIHPSNHAWIDRRARVVFNPKISLPRSLVSSVYIQHPSMQWIGRIGEHPTAPLISTKSHIIMGITIPLIMGSPTAR